MDKNQRLRQARVNAGFATAREACKAHGWGEAAYTHHENGTRNFPEAKAVLYANAFNVSPTWLIFGKEIAKPTAPLFSYPLVPLATIDEFMKEDFPRVNKDFKSLKPYSDKAFAIKLDPNEWEDLHHTPITHRKPVKILFDPEKPVDNDKAALILYRGKPLIRTFYDAGRPEWHPPKESRFPVIPASEDVTIVGKICEIAFTLD